MLIITSSIKLIILFSFYDEFYIYSVFDQIKLRNTYYDMYEYNTLFFNNLPSGSLEKRIGLYFDYIKGIYNNTKFEGYQNKILLIDVTSWDTKGDDIHNPIMYLTIAFRKYFNKFSSLGDMNIILYTVLRANDICQIRLCYTVLSLIMISSFAIRLV
jgi:hypothetical protein